MNIPNDVALWLQAKLRELAVDDSTCAGVSSGNIDGIEDCTLRRWQFEVDVLYRLIKCGLAMVPYFQIDCHNLDSFLVGIRTLNPFDPRRGGGIWNGTFLRGTDKLRVLIDKYFPQSEPYDASLNPAFVKELEEMFQEHDVAWSDAPLFPIMPK
jgi:hypothetical protein